MGGLVVALLRCTDLRAEVDPLSGAITREPRTAALSASDAAALEHALRIGSAWGARVLAISLGGPEVEGPLREALALGAEVLRVATHQSYLEELFVRQTEQNLMPFVLEAVRANATLGEISDVFREAWGAYREKAAF